MTDFDDRMAILRASFVARAIEARGMLAAALDARAYDELRRTTHSLAGNAGIFGYPEVTEAARALEDALDAPASDTAITVLVQKLDDRLAALS